MLDSEKQAICDALKGTYVNNKNCYTFAGQAIDEKGEEHNLIENAEKCAGRCADWGMCVRSRSTCNGMGKQMVDWTAVVVVVVAISLCTSCCIVCYQLSLKCTKQKPAEPEPRSPSSGSRSRSRSRPRRWGQKSDDESTEDGNISEIEVEVEAIRGILRNAQPQGLNRIDTRV